MRKVLDAVMALVFIALFSGLMFVVIIEWLAGCGESYTDANGVVHQYECVFINFNKE